MRSIPCASTHYDADRLDHEHLARLLRYHCYHYATSGEPNPQTEDYERLAADLFTDPIEPEVDQ